MALVALSLLATSKCYNADLAQSLSGVPIVGAMIAPPAAAPAYVDTIGTPAPTSLPDTDPKTWFPTDATADPYNPTTWTAIRDFLANTGNEAGFTEACKKITDAVGADRTSEPVLGALACSEDPSVTALQAFPLALLSLQAEVALWLKDAPGFEHRGDRGAAGRAPAAVHGRHDPAAGRRNRAVRQRLYEGSRRVVPQRRRRHHVHGGGRGVRRSRDGDREAGPEDGGATGVLRRGGRDEDAVVLLRAVCTPRRALPGRLPPFSLTNDDVANLRSKLGSQVRGRRRHVPCADPGDEHAVV